MKGMADDLPAELAAFLRDELGDVPNRQAASFKASGEVWIWSGSGKDGEPAKGRWYFMSVTGEVAEAIRIASAGRSGGWGSVKVEVSIGSTCWTTSLFPSQSAGGYLLPLKAAVRKAEKIDEGSHIEVSLTLA